MDQPAGQVGPVSGTDCGELALDSSNPDHIRSKLLPYIVILAATVRDELASQIRNSADL
jgi:hypothetical protein